MRRLVVALFALVLLTAPLGAKAQQAGKIQRIGALRGHSTDLASDTELQVFRERLRDLGWVEGQNLVIEYRFAGGKVDQLTHLASELVQLNVGVIFATGRAAQAAKQVTTTIPIVTVHPDPVAAGLAASLARPGGNVTGLSLFASFELGTRGLQMLKETIPRASRVALLWDSSVPGVAGFLEAKQAAARTLGVRLETLMVRSDEELASVLKAVVRDRPDALYIPDFGVNYRNMKLIVDFAMTHRVPAVYMDREYVEAGGLMSYGPSWKDLVRRAAVYVDKILKGAKPADLPIEQPTKFELVVNLKTAKALGLTIPQSVLLRADEVIQ
jgi:ABC-type uncharacterized transport system substrate-binding protein